MRDQTKNKSTRQKKIIVVVLLVLVVLAAGLWLIFSLTGQKNYAQQAALPLERAFIEAGAKKLCSAGDPGRGPDNRTPWYTVYMESSMSQKQAEDTINAVGKANNYTLERSSPGTKGYLGDVVYTDMNKQSTNAELKAGQIELSVALTNSGPLHACKDEVANDANNTAFSLELRLPDYK